MFDDMELKWTLNLTNWNRDKENWVFVLEFEDSLSREVITIEIWREEMAEIFFSNYYKCEQSCKITIPENIGKQRITEKHLVKMEWYSLKEEYVKRYFEENWMNYDELERYEQRTQSGTRYWKPWEPNEQEIMIIKYV